MVPKVLPEDAEVLPDHVTSHDESCDLSATPPSHLPLTMALRVSIAGEMGLDHQEGTSHTGTQPVQQLTIPEDVPVDLRAKLAVSLIHLGKDMPEVRIWTNGCHDVLQVSSIHLPRFLSSVLTGAATPHLP